MTWRRREREYGARPPRGYTEAWGEFVRRGIAAGSVAEQAPAPTPRQRPPDTRPTESADQLALAQWVDTTWWWPAWQHTAAEGNSASETFRKSARGLRAGVPDNLLWLESGVYRGAASELKRVRSTPSSVRPTQRAWLARLEALGWQVGVHRGYDEAREFFAGYVERLDREQEAVARAWCREYSDARTAQR